MDVSLNQAYEVALRTIGELVVTNKLLTQALAEAQLSGSPEGAEGM